MVSLLAFEANITLTRRQACLLSISALFFVGSCKKSSAINADEITTLLAGKTAIGVWAGSEYRQYFNPDGSTIYAQYGSRSALGKWRVNTDTNQYESWWESSGWESWRVTLENGTYYWVGDGGKFAFEVVEGQQLIWE